VDQEAASSPEALREQIAQTRADLAETMEAIEEKLDREHLKRRAQDEIFAHLPLKALPGPIAQRVNEGIHRVRWLALAHRIHARSVRHWSRRW
jgi:hypothetical protein